MSGGPSSVYADHAPKVDPAIFALGIPVFGICYGFQTMAAALAGVVAQTGKSEFGRTPLDVKAGSKMFAGLPASQSVWMSHGDAVAEVPCGFSVTASTSDTPIAAFEDASGTLAGVQFHPEVLHTEHGQATHLCIRRSRAAAQRRIRASTARLCCIHRSRTRCR